MSGGAPKPANFDAMWQAAARGDEVAFGVENARYRAQLADQGFEAPRLQGWLDPVTGEVA